MRISAKGRYALASCIVLAEHKQVNELVSVIAISKRLNISKIYLEQVFSRLKSGGLVRSVKGANGGYELVNDLDKITAYDILQPIESSLFEPAKGTVEEAESKIEDALFNLFYVPIDEVIKEKLLSINLEDLYEGSLKTGDEYRFYI